MRDVHEFSKTSEEFESEFIPCPPLAPVGDTPSFMVPCEQVWEYVDPADENIENSRMEETLARLSSFRNRQNFTPDKEYQVDIECLIDSIDLMASRQALI